MSKKTITRAKKSSMRTSSRRVPLTRFGKDVLAAIVGKISSFDEPDLRLTLDLVTVLEARQRA